MNQTASEAIRPILLVEDRAVDVDLTKRAFAKRKLLNPITVARAGAEALALRLAGSPKQQPTFALVSLACARPSRFSGGNLRSDHIIGRTIGRLEIDPTTHAQFVHDRHADAAAHRSTPGVRGGTRDRPHPPTDARNPRRSAAFFRR